MSSPDRRAGVKRPSMITLLRVELASDKRTDSIEEEPRLTNFSTLNDL
jgi:hypothetical protein